MAITASRWKHDLVTVNSPIASNVEQEHVRHGPRCRQCAPIGTPIDAHEYSPKRLFTRAAGAAGARETYPSFLGFAGNRHSRCYSLRGLQLASSKLPFAQDLSANDLSKSLFPQGDIRSRAPCGRGARRVAAQAVAQPLTARRSTAPILRAASFPRRNSSRVGIPRMPCRITSSRSLSVLTRAKRSRGSSIRAA